jgi:tetratricopeptide (TPR) repeat protein
MLAIKFRGCFAWYGIVLMVNKPIHDKSLDSLTEFKEGVEFLKNDYPQKALVKLQSAFESDKHNPFYISFLGVSIARSQRNWAKASELCDMAVQLNPKEIQFHLNLAEVYSLAGLREMSLYKLDYALGLFGDDPRLERARSKIEKRRTPVLPFFGREHFLNRKLGKLRHRILKDAE